MLLLWTIFVVNVLCCHAFLSVHCSLVVTCWERADLLARLYVEFSSVFVTIPCGVMGQVWYLIVSIIDLCPLTYFVHYTFLKLHKSNHKIRYMNSLAVRVIPYNSKLFLCYCKIIKNLIKLLSILTCQYHLYL